MKILSRRRFVGMSSIALGGAFVGSRVFGPFNLLANTTGQALPRLPELALERPETNLVKARLTATEAVASVGGVMTKMLTYNGSFPGPLLRLREGERIQLQFTNGLNQHTSLHLHGLRVPPAVDDPFRHGHPGDVAEYNFEVKAGSAGTYWYHPHVHGQVSQQLFSGLAGAIVIEGPLDNLPELRAAEEHVLVLKDMSLTGVEVAPHLPWEIGGKQGNLTLVNGALGPVLRAGKGTLRLRLLNASTARFFRLSLEGHTMHLIASDGGFIERPQPLSEIRLAPGERAEVLVQLETGSFKLLDGLNPLLTVEAPARLLKTPLPSELAKIERLDLASVRVRRQVVFDTAGLGKFQLNNRAFDMSRVDFEARFGDLEIWELHNEHSIEHPFHLHSYPFQVLSRDGKAEPFMAWHDTVNLLPGQRVQIAIPLRDYAGRTVFHCHIAEHEDAGMMAVLEVKRDG